MTTKDQLSELELDLSDKNKETLDLKQELDELKSTNQEMTVWLCDGVVNGVAVELLLSDPLSR